ncbi:MAG: hypothetical protein PVF23_10210 [Chromatiales bacterium]|jgi:hypothetical protein
MVSMPCLLEGSFADLFPGHLERYFSGAGQRRLDRRQLINLEDRVFSSIETSDYSCV